ncbi:putative death-receptor fusion protein (DUF2428) [Teratosphaeria destructans]|uniref:Death-receptor fusion protein (DUF2428) n=1 Tax=Teratosphaeria destructans TaxID=418781 RepID=A0A9W7SSF9_9PEZI|nr:putative death-receptor fusion protein (DUF2428) [Teratosphaeria destructans]
MSLSFAEQFLGVLRPDLPGDQSEIFVLSPRPTKYTTTIWAFEVPATAIAADESQSISMAAETVLAEDHIKHMSRNARAFVAEQEGAEVDNIGEILQLLDHIFATASSLAISVSHKVAAWNTLCAFLDRISNSKAGTIRDLVWTNGLWKHAFDLYLSQAHLVRPKSSRQLLTSITAALRQAQTSETVPNEVEQDGIRSLVYGVVVGKDQGSVKTCAQALSSFLGKDVVSLQALLDFMPLSASMSCPPGVDEFLLVLFKWMSRADFGSTIGQLVSTVLDRSNELKNDSINSHSATTGLPIWSSALKASARTGAVDMPSLRVHLLPVLFRRSASEYMAFLYDLGLERLGGNRSNSTSSPQGLADTELLYASLQTGKDIGFVQEFDGVGLSCEEDVVYVPLYWIGRLLQQATSSARSTGLSLLINCQSMTRPFSRTAFRLIKRNLGHFFADTDADFRSDVFGYVQRLLDRIRAITAVLVRQSAQRSDPALAEIMDNHRSFLTWLLHFTVWELRPTSSYQRHISALKCLSILVRSGLDPHIQPGHLSKSARRETCWPFNLQILTTESCRTLLDLLVDPFDDVRQTAASILAIGLASMRDQAWLRLALGRAEDAMLNTGRADQADGVAHAYSLLHASMKRNGDLDVVRRDLYGKLEHALITAQADLPRAVQRYPLHGLLTSIRYVLANSEEEQRVNSLSRLAPLLQAVWNVVKPILCNDAPEGYLPENFEETIDVSTKDTLSFCWRALKEASLLMGVLVSSAGTNADNGGRVLCDLSFTQLAELRHRGAFSTVARTWTSCCSQPWARFKLHEWYDQSLLILRNKTTINTRRSAGLPSLLCGILVADSSARLMQQAFNDLEMIARETVDPAFAQDGSLPQVHAMNCCKDILKNSRLGEQSEKHVPSALQLAADALRSDAWAVRNCGLMLFRAVIDRLLGTSDAHLEDGKSFQKKLSPEQHPQLLGIVLGILSSPAGEPTTLQQAHQEGVFPALQLLQRLAIPTERLTEVRQSVNALMASSSWHIRDRAARTYSSFVSEDDTIPEIREILQNTACNQNVLHGALLAARYILRTLIPSREQAHLTDDAAADKPSLVSLITAGSRLYAENKCPITRAAFIELYALAHQLEYMPVSNICQRTIVQFKVAGGTQTISPLGDLSFAIEQEHTKRSIGIAALRLPLAKLLATQLLSLADDEEPYAKRIVDCVARLARVDADATAAFFHRGRDLVERSAPIIHNNIRGLVVFVEAAACLLDDSSVDIRAVCAAQEVLITICTLSRKYSIEINALLTFAEASFRQHHLTRHNDNQRSVDLALQLYGALLEHHDRVEAPDSLFVQWANVCCNAIAGVGLHTREAAAQALSETTIWRELIDRQLESTFLQLCFATYDLLNDDDEGIRLTASHTSTNILRTSGQMLDQDLVPLVVGSRLLTLMLTRWRSHPELMEEAFTRAFGMTTDTVINARAEMANRMQANAALFAEEKQNLYIDEEREVRVWSQVFLHIPPIGIAPTLRRLLASWVQESLQTLLEKAGSSQDGPLGWSTDPEVFVLGLRVFYGAEVLLWWVRGGVRIHIRPSVLKTMLLELAGVSQINMLWRTEIERIVAGSVVHSVQLLRSRLSAYCGG